MLKPFLILSTLVLAGVTAQSPQAPAPGSEASATPAAPATDAKIPLEAVKQVNPIKPSSESLARAKKIYGYECALCHGDDGGGGGDLAKNMKSKMVDLRDPSTLKGRTDGEIYYIINHGMGEMEGEGARVKPDDTWNLVNYVRSLAKGQPAVATTGPA
jgi:mono/diheme cytochrome c family protein